MLTRNIIEIESDIVSKMHLKKNKLECSVFIFFFVECRHMHVFNLIR